MRKLRNGTSSESSYLTQASAWSSGICAFPLATTLPEHVSTFLGHVQFACQAATHYNLQLGECRQPGSHVITAQFRTLEVAEKTSCSKPMPNIDEAFVKPSAKETRTTTLPPLSALAPRLAWTGLQRQLAASPPHTLGHFGAWP